MHSLGGACGGRLPIGSVPVIKCYYIVISSRYGQPRQRSSHDRNQGNTDRGPQFIYNNFIPGDLRTTYCKCDIIDIE